MQQITLRFVLFCKGCKVRDHRVSKEFAVSTMEATKEDSSLTTTSSNPLLDSYDEQGTGKARHVHFGFEDKLKLNCFQSAFLGKPFLWNLLSKA